MFLFDFLVAPYAADPLRALIERFEREYPAPQVPTYVLENHDRERSMSRLDDDGRKARVMAALLCTLRGTSVLFQGQEIGMTNHYIPLRDANDPIPGVVAKHLPEWVHRRLPERLNRDEVRVPMQWTGEPGAGFTSGGAVPWLPIHPAHVDVNVEAQTTDPGSLFNWYRDLLALRRSSPALTAGTLQLFDTHPDVIAYERRAGDERILVVANLGERWITHPTNGARPAAISDPSVEISRSAVRLAPHSAAVARLVS